MNHKRLLELFWEFNNFIVSLHTLYLDSIIGFKALHNAVVNHQNQMIQFLGECEVTAYNSLKKIRVCLILLAYKSICYNDT